MGPKTVSLISPHSPHLGSQLSLPHPNFVELHGSGDSLRGMGSSDSPSPLLWVRVPQGRKGDPLSKDVERGCSACGEGAVLWRPQTLPVGHPKELTFPHVCKGLVLLHRMYQKSLAVIISTRVLAVWNCVGKQTSPQEETFHN